MMGHAVTPEGIILKRWHSIWSLIPCWVNGERLCNVMCPAVSLDEDGRMLHMSCIDTAHHLDFLCEDIPGVTVDPDSIGRAHTHAKGRQ